MTDKTLKKVREFIEEIVTANGKYPELNNTQIIADAYKTLTALNSYIEERSSEDMVDRVAKAIAHALDGMSEKYYTHAKAAIKAMEGGE